MDVHAIEARDLSKSYGTTKAVVDLNLAVDAGDVVGFLGPNGAGKSTTIRMLLGLLRPNAGEALIMGRPSGSAEARARVAYVPGDVALWPQLTGREAIDFLGALHGTFDAAYRDELIQRFELNPSKKIRAYSTGNRQKVAIIAAFATRADALLLDEPTAGLDPLMERVFRGCVLEAQERGQAILLSSHLLAEVEHLCENVAMIRDGVLTSLTKVADLRSRVGIEYEVTGAVGDVGCIEGVSEVTALPDGALIRVVGPPGPLLAALAARGVTSVRSKEASLEEIFMSFYDGAPAAT
jgi:ABC-2 type transport system ATP-binding protein